MRWTGNLRIKTLREGETVRIFTSSTADAVPLPLKGKDNNALPKRDSTSNVGRHPRRASIDFAVIVLSKTIDVGRDHLIHR